MLDAFGVRFRRFGRHAERTQEVDHQPMADADALRQRLPLLAEEHAAIRPRGREPGALEAGNRLNRGGVRNAETSDDIGRPRLAVLQLSAAAGQSICSPPNDPLRAQ